MFTLFQTLHNSTSLDKLIYNEKYEVIDKNMSSSNIGGCKNRNIRDHLFVINAMLQEASKNKDLCDVGVTDDHFNLIAYANQKLQVAVKTRGGSLCEIEMQGKVLKPLKCSVQIDTLSKEILTEDKSKCFSVQLEISIIGDYIMF